MHKKNVLLINPWIYDFSAYDYWIKPLGLLYLASYLRKNELNVRFIDCLNPRAEGGRTDETVTIPNKKPGGHGKFPKKKISTPPVLNGISKKYHRYGMSPEFFQEMLACGPKPDLILVTVMMTYWYAGAFDLIRILKNRFPGVPIAMGGNYVTLCQDHAHKSGADYLLPGAGESHLPFIIRNVLDRPLLFQPDLQNPDTLPYPAFDLLIKPDQVPMLTSRGCPFRCSYCASHRLYDGFKRRTPLKVVDEVAHWMMTLGIADFSFYDDALLTKPDEMIIPFMREIIKRGMVCHFHCPNGLHLREMTPELARLMHKSGFRTLRFGFETSDMDRQLAMGGKATNTQLDSAVAYLREAGYSGRDIGVYILCGLPGQEGKEVCDTIRYVQSRGAKPILAEFSPIPGTDYWEQAVASSVFPLKEEPLFQNNSLLPCRNDNLTLTRYQELKRLTRHPSI